ncbi:hypothetical protein OSB04_028312 [Centaurea solstitialis]|uniref:Uncharacterized protein n=1 Tax=Centaurea solstitialis TaxID=347529 RepID=A0AA38WB15_9ASTR|nr:hypothetical protein OSB04_028312 [Centaurea solstitialis]
METHGRAPTLRSTEPIPATRRRILMFPLPIQGHINPLLQLASILHTQGFKITIIHTEYNSPNHSNYPHFTFKSIQVDFSEVIKQFPNEPASFYLKMVNDRCVDPFRNCLAESLKDEEDPVSCLITDAGLYFTQAVADELKIPRMAFRTSSLGATVAYGVLIELFEKGYLTFLEKITKHRCRNCHF